MVKTQGLDPFYLPYLPYTCPTTGPSIYSAWPTKPWRNMAARAAMPPLPLPRVPSLPLTPTGVCRSTGSIPGPPSSQELPELPLPRFTPSSRHPAAPLGRGRRKLASPLAHASTLSCLPSLPQTPADRPDPLLWTSSCSPPPCSPRHGRRDVPTPPLKP